MMTTLDARLWEATTQVAHAIGHGRPPRLTKTTKKKRRHAFTPDPAMARSLREAGVAEKDIQTLIEGHRHEVESARLWAAPGRIRTEIPERIDRALATFHEQAATEDTGQLTMPPSMRGWNAEGDSGAVFSHAKHGQIRLQGNRWTHHAVGGRIVKSGTTQEALTSHLRGLVGDTGNSGAADASAESLSDVLDRVRGVTRVPPGTHERLAEALSRTARSASTTGGEDLHSRLRKALVRP